MGREKILITGGAGYIGSHVAWAAADAGHEIIVLDDLSTGCRDNVPPTAEFIKGNVGDPAQLGKILSDPSITAVMHFAGKVVVPESIADPITYYRENTSATLALLAGMVEAGTKTLLFSSTAAVYQPQDGMLRLPEDAPKAPLSPYGQSKLMSEAMIADICNAHGLGAMVLRYFNVAGADPAGRTGQSGPSSTHLLRVATQTALGLRERLTVFGDDYPTPDGTCQRDFIHVTDLAEAHMLALDHAKRVGGRSVMNCGYGRGTSVREMIRAVEGVTGEPLPIEIGERRPGDAPVMVADPRRIFDTLDWQPSHDNLDEMARTAISWEKRQIGAK
ncbi:UDP-glucose 4-epimerase GalE [Parvularcula marina]|uniref:UDP-glucose 4-epimerase GalE n=1 Tax=Parvularcula marina TaxID=2292771 RepID=UPI00351376FB